MGDRHPSKSVRYHGVLQKQQSRQIGQSHEYVQNVRHFPGGADAEIGADGNSQEVGRTVESPQNAPLPYQIPQALLGVKIPADDGGEGGTQYHCQWCCDWI